MIISGRRTDFDLRNGRIFLPDWARAPVFLNESSKIWGVYHRPKQIHSHSVTELVVTSIPREHWSDVWRLEITTEDRPGNLARIYEIFDESGIEVLFNEGSMHSFAQYHSMSFILSLLGYENNCDGGSLHRSQQPLPSVPGLESVIQLRFLNQLVFEKEDEPRFLLKRLNLYWLMDREINRRTELRHPFTIGEDGGFTPDTDFIDTVRRLGKRGSMKVQYTPAADTDFRCIRVLFFPSNDVSPGHLQFLGHNLTTAEMHRIMQIVREHKGNIIRLQLRPGFPKSPRGRFGRLQTKTSVNDKHRRARFDLTIEPAELGDTTKKLLKRIEDAVFKDPLLKERKIDISVPKGELGANRVGRTPRRAR